ncbi:BCCT family transporter, partial [Amaricoccus solimangrovi]
LGTLPMPWLVIPLFILLCFVFLATTLDSAAYVLASVTTRELSGYQEPKRSIRVTWALILAGVGIALIQLGGLKPVQTSTIVVALPLIPVLVVLTLSLMRWLREDFGSKSENARLAPDTAE